MPMIDITEYRLPNGSRYEHLLEVTEDVAAKVTLLNAANCHIEYELLRDGTQSWTIADRVEEQDIDMELCFNPTHEKGVEALAKMIMRVKVPERAS